MFVIHETTRIQTAGIPIELIPGDAEILSQLIASQKPAEPAVKKSEDKQ